jgi:hypothetical protein
MIDSILLSTLECFYLDTCLSIYYHYIVSSRLTMQETGWFMVRPLIYNEASDHFTPNTSLSVIVKRMMVEQWDSVYSFEQYYEACAPTYCTYTEATRINGFAEIIIKIVSTIGGLTVALRLITPHFINFIFYLLTPKVRKQRRGNH